ncbi:MAG TPA: NAD(P)-dependent alcohol dehydrogenase [Caulobacteraceae bacterium]
MGRPARAAVLRAADRPMAIEAVEVDEPRDGEVLVAIAATGVCHTDMVMRDALLPVPRPVVLGHEGAGHVLAVGSGVTHVAPGDAVVLSFASCGHCSSCDARQPAYCHEFFPRNFLATRADGSTALRDAGGPIHSHVFGQSSFATHAIAPARNVVKVDADLPIEILGPLGCGIQTGAGAVLNALDVRPGASIAVIGTGAVGLSAVMAAKIAGARTILAIDRSVSRTQLALELGATHAVVADARTVPEIVSAVGLGGVDYALDTTGHTGLVEQAIAALNPRGEIGLIAAFAPGASIGVDATHLMSAGRVVRGIVEGSADPQSFIPELIGHFRAGRLPFDRLIEMFDFADILAAIEAGESGRVVKPVVRMR